MEEHGGNIEIQFIVIFYLIRGGKVRKSGFRWGAGRHRTKRRS